MKTGLRFWINISLINLLLVAVLGTIMRYKIGFSFPYLDQKNLQHAHSHFAFIGWITHTLFVLMASVIQKDYADFKVRKYRNLIVTNLICAYGMLFSFAAGGYNALSITLSTASIFTSYLFALVLFSDMQKMGDRPYRNWFTAALWFNIISSLGTFTLGLMMATHNFDQKIHLASLYYYLHFQYNGFFMFACMGLLIAQISWNNPAFKLNNLVFWLLCISCIPAYFLSALWIKLPIWLYALVIASALAQVAGWIMFLQKTMRLPFAKTPMMQTVRFILLIVTISLSVKYLLQLGSTIPYLGNLAFGFRPIVIAYLHLILLAIISVFLVTYCMAFVYPESRKARRGIIAFVVAVYINQLLLGVQGIASLSYTAVPQMNTYLFIAAVLILLSILFLLFLGRGKSSGPSLLKA